MVKVLSMIAERQVLAIGQQGRRAKLVPFHEIRHSVSYLLSVQKNDGSFGDSHPVVYLEVLVIEAPYLFSYRLTPIGLNYICVFHHRMAKMGEHL